MRHSFTLEEKLNALKEWEKAGSVDLASQRLGIGVSTLWRWRLQAQTRALDASKSSNGPHLTNVELALLQALARETPDVPLKALAAAFSTRAGRTVSIGTISKALHGAGFVRVRPTRVVSVGVLPTDTRYKDVHRPDPRKRYPSSLTDAEWLAVEPLFAPRSTRGRKPKYARRAMADAVFYVLRTGCQWRMLPKDFPPFGVVWMQFCRWRDAKVLDAACVALVKSWRTHIGRDPEPTAAVIDSQSVKTTEKGGSAAMTAASR